MPLNNEPMPLIGIDLGTTHSLIAVWREGKAQLIPNALGNVLTPSVVSVADDGNVIVGQAAKDRLFTHANATAQVFKRSMGTKRNYQLSDRSFAPEDLSALVLQNLRLDAEHFLGQSVRDAIISVPAYFNDAQRQSTKAAAAIAGLNVLRLINEPTAAALAYGLHQTSSETQFMIVDLGGGTLDVSVVELFEGVIEIKASTGDNQLGGEDFTHALAQLLREQMLFWRQMSAGMKNEAHSTLVNIKPEASVTKTTLETRLILPQGHAFLHAQAERCKRELTHSDSLEWEAVFEGETYAFNITQAAFEKACTGLMERMRKPIERALRDSGVRVRGLTEVVLVGGASRMPHVQKMLVQMLGRSLNTRINPDEAIALGAAVQAGLVGLDAALADVMMTDVCPYSLGIEIVQNLGANQTEEGVFSPIIERNTLIPTSRMQTYSPAQDYQSELLMNVYQGEARLVKDNIALGKLAFALPRRKREDVSVDVRFSYDVSGLLEVDVTIQPGGKQHRLSLLGQSSHLSEAEISKRSAVLASLKIDPREMQPNRALLARLDRLFAEHLGEQRDVIARQHIGFLSTLASQDVSLIARARTRLNNWCQAVEQHSPWDDDDLFGEAHDADR